MSSGADDEDAHRRRDLIHLLNFHHPFLSFWFLLSFCICIHLSKNPNFPPPPLAFFSQKPEHYSIDISYGSRSELTSAPPTTPPYWFSLMARLYLGPSDAPFPVRTSTAHSEIQSWQVAPLVASSPTITTSKLQSDSGKPSSTTSILGFCSMGFTSNCGPIIISWPIYKNCRKAYTLPIFEALYAFADPSPSLRILRSDFLNALVTLVLKICCSIENGRRRYSISVTIFLDETCYYKSQNLMDRAAWLSPDASLILKLIGLEFLSNHRWCDLDHASVLICDYISSINRSIMKLNHPRSFLSILLLPIRHCLGSLVDLDVRRLHLRLRLPKMFGIYIGCVRILVNAPFVTLFATSYHWKKQVCLNLLLVPSVPTCQLLPQGRRLGSDLNSQGQPDYKLCVEFLNLHGQWLHVREDPHALLRLVTHQMRFPVSSSPKATSTWQPSNPLVSSVEHTFKSSYASIIRAKYDHLLVRDFLKLVFKLESYKTSKDLPSLASSSRLCIFLEDSCSLYLFISCNSLLLSCNNIPFLRF